MSYCVNLYNLDGKALSCSKKNSARIQLIFEIAELGSAHQNSSSAHIGLACQKPARGHHQTEYAVPPLNSPNSAISTHRESELRNDRGIIYFWKKYILVYSCIQKQGKKKKYFLHCPFKPPAKQHSQFSPKGWIGSASWLVA